MTDEQAMILDKAAGFDAEKLSRERDLVERILIEPGHYLLRMHPGVAWEPAQYEDGDWWLIGVEERVDDPAAIGPEIEPPPAIKEHRRYAAFFEGENKQLKERGVADLLIDFLKTRGERFILPPAVVASDPPDVEVYQSKLQIRVGIEVTEIVSEEHVKIAAGTKYAELQREPCVKQWTEESLVREIQTRFLSKLRKWRKSERQAEYDQFVIVFHTDETTITPDLAEHSALSIRLHGDGLINRAFLLLSYNPNVDRSEFPSGYPVYELTVE